MMTVCCTKCGRPLADIEPPTFHTAEANAVRRTLGAKVFGFDLAGLSDAFDMLTNPTPESIAKTFGVCCPPWKGCRADDPPPPGLIQRLAIATDLDGA